MTTHENLDPAYDFDLYSVKDDFITICRSNESLADASRVQTPYSQKQSFDIGATIRRPSFRPRSSTEVSNIYLSASTSISGSARFEGVKTNSNHTNNTESDKRSLLENECPVESTKRIERDINQLIDQSATLKKNMKRTEALEAAKDAISKLEMLKRIRKTHSLPNDFHQELMCATWFNIALAYEANNLLDEAIKSYAVLAKQSGNPLRGYARINMGNIYYAQHDYKSAIKMYQMAVDQLRNDRQISARIRRNLGNALFHQGKIRESVKSFEESMDICPDQQTGFNLLICHHSLGDVESVRKDFLNMLKVPVYRRRYFTNNDEQTPEDDTEDLQIKSSISKYDDQDLTKRERAAKDFIFNAARITAPLLDLENVAAGYVWVRDSLKNHYAQLANRIEHEAALQQLKQDEIKSAVEMLNMIEKKGAEIKAKVAISLSFINFLLCDTDSASKHADIAIEVNRYDSKALVNRGNCFFINKDYTSAKNLYIEAMRIEANCSQAIFNLGLTFVKTREPEKAMKEFEKLHTITPSNPTVIYQIADIYEKQGDLSNAIQWLNVLTTRLPNDPVILSRLGYLCSKMHDDSQGLHYQLESFRHFPTNLDNIAWIGAWFVQQKMYEKSIHFFQQAALNQPKEIKWGLMVASAHRRTGNHVSALVKYENLHSQFPENIECLNCLITASKALQRPFNIYQERLEKLSKTDS